MADPQESSAGQITAIIVTATGVAIASLIVSMLSATNSGLSILVRFRGGRRPPPEDEADDGDVRRCLTCKKPTTLIDDSNGQSYWQCINNPPHKFAVKTD